MKKYLFYIILSTVITLPVSASCPLNGTCTGAGASINSAPLQDRYIPNNLNNLLPKDNLNKINQPQNTLNEELKPENISPQSIYQNCQFGECFPTK